MTPLACTVAFLQLDVADVCVVAFSVVYLLTIAYGVGHSQGWEAFRQERRLQASQDTADRLGLLREVDRHQTGGRR